MKPLASIADDLRLFAKYHLRRRVVDYPARETELGIVSLGYDPEAYASAIRAHGDAFDVSTLTEVEYEGRRHPILQVVRRASPPRHRLLVLAGVHGNEHAGLLAILDLLGTLRSLEGADDVEVRVITPVNPVGAAHLSRYNGLGYDINRDFVRFDTPEARMVREVAEASRPDFVVSLHEGPQDATFMFTNRAVPDPLAARVLDAVRDGGTELATRDYFGSRLSPPGHSPMGSIGWTLNAAWAATLQMMSTCMWFGEQGIPESTLESSWRHEQREARVRGHVDLALAVIRALSTSEHAS